MTYSVVWAKTILREWDSFREQMFPMKEFEKMRAYFQTPEARNMPDREQRNLDELNALVRRILDSSSDKRAEILSGSPIELKTLFAFRLLRGNAFLRQLTQAHEGVRVPQGENEMEAIHSLFLDLLLRS